MKPTDLVNQQALALLDAELAWAESERNDLDVRWARAKPGSLQEKAQLQALHRLDREIEQLNIKRHLLVCAMRSERHLRLLQPGE